MTKAEMIELLIPTYHNVPLERVVQLLNRQPAYLLRARIELLTTTAGTPEREAAVQSKRQAIHRLTAVTGRRGGYSRR